MHLQIVTFQLDGVDEAAYRAHVDATAPAFAELAGLRSTVWVADAARKTYGGVHTWDDQAATTAYENGNLFQGLRANPAMRRVRSRDFAVLEEPTKITHGGR